LPTTEGDVDQGQPIPQTGFTIEFAWIETPESARLEVDPAAAAAAAAEATPDNAAAPATTP
jgi:hypothetical protein